MELDQKLKRWRELAGDLAEKAPDSGSVVGREVQQDASEPVGLNSDDPSSSSSCSVPPGQCVFNSASAELEAKLTGRLMKIEGMDGLMSQYRQRFSTQPRKPVEDVRLDNVEHLHLEMPNLDCERGVSVDYVKRGSERERKNTEENEFLQTQKKCQMSSQHDNAENNLLELQYSEGFDLLNHMPLEKALNVVNLMDRSEQECKVLSSENEILRDAVERLQVELQSKSSKGEAQAIEPLGSLSPSCMAFSMIEALKRRGSASLEGLQLRPWPWLSSAWEDTSFEAEQPSRRRATIASTVDHHPRTDSSLINTPRDDAQLRRYRDFLCLSSENQGSTRNSEPSQCDT